MLFFRQHKLMGYKDIHKFMIKIFGLLLLIILSCQAVATTAKVYVWRNAKGVLVYSDTPKPGAEEVKITPKNIISSSINTSFLDITPDKVKESFQVEISQPKSNETIRDNTGSVYIRGLVKPIFKVGLKVQLYFDGKKHQQPQTKAIFSLKNVDRGEHRIKLNLINNKGKVIASSKFITFYMHRISIHKGK